MKYSKDHDPKCPSKARRLYIRNYDPIRKKQVFTIWGATCLSCGRLFHIVHTPIKGSKSKNYFLNRGERRRFGRIKTRVSKKIDSIEDPKMKTLMKKRYEYMLKTGK